LRQKSNDYKLKKAQLSQLAKEYEELYTLEQSLEGKAQELKKQKGFSASTMEEAQQVLQRMNNIVAVTLNMFIF
jgi:hypothetical protein